MHEVTMPYHSPLCLHSHGNGAPQNGIHTMSFNPAENAVLLTAQSDGGVYELYQLPKSGEADSTSEGKRGAGKFCVLSLAGMHACSCLHVCQRPVDLAGRFATWVARNRFAVLDKYNAILIKDLANATTKTISPPTPTESLFYAGTGSLLLGNADSVTVFDVQQRRAMATLSVSKVKYVVWNKDMSRAALLSKHTITICDRKLKQLCSVHETIRVKVGCNSCEPKRVTFVFTLSYVCRVRRGMTPGC